MILSAINRRRQSRVEGGFTLVELLVVIVILAVLIGLLVPAIYGACRTARKAAVTSEINQLASALAAFKSRYGDYPPSRFLCVESGNYTIYLNSPGNSPLNVAYQGVHDPTSPGVGDIGLPQLAQRSVSAIRKFWPRVSTVGSPAGQWYDFNGNGVQDNPYILHGHECLVFFLGGVPQPSSQTGLTGALTSVSFGMSGFDKNPNNPFTNNIVGNGMYGPNRQPPMFEFVPGRLFADANSLTGVPGYYDTLGGLPGTASGLNFYAYFSSYGNGGYDPNDMNYQGPLPQLYEETDANLNGPIGLSFSVTFPTVAANVAGSSAPNPYTSTLSETQLINPSGPPAVTFLNANTFQIISAGIDGLYGVGGQYLASSTTSATSTNPLPVDPTALIGTTGDPTIRQRESDNLTNFKAGSLQ